MPLSMIQEIAIREPNGQCRCPYCGKFRKLEDFPCQPGHTDYKEDKIHCRVHTLPMCKTCYNETNVDHAI